MSGRRVGGWTDDEWQAAVESALAEAPVVAPRSAPADPRSLRGIPMIGGAEGAIPGTSPHRNRRLERWRPHR